MARAARDAGREAARLGLLIAVTACAVIEDPPGGPPDYAAPTVATVVPDSGAVVPDLDKPLRIEFDEVISEQSGGGLDKLVRFSPRVRELKVEWKRNAIEIRPKDGWRQNAVYRVVLLPGVADLRNNRMEAGRTVVFTTGGEIPQTSLTGVVLDWEGGRVGRLALVEAILLPDSLVYTAQADSTGEFTLTEIPRGQYLVVATIDANSSRLRESREAFDSVTVALDSAATNVFWAVVRDTVGPQIRDVARVDSLTVSLEFSQKLRPGAPDTGAVAVWLLPDTVAVPIAAVWEAATYDSIATAERALADSIAQAARDSAATADSLATPPDSVPPPPDSAAAPPARARPPTGQREVLGRPAQPPAPAAAAPDSSRAALLLQERPTLSSRWYIRMPAALAPGRYLIDARAFNITDVAGQSQRVLVIEAPRDST
jgi:hypothetical protein